MLTAIWIILISYRLVLGDANKTYNNLFYFILQNAKFVSSKVKNQFIIYILFKYRI